MTSLREEHEGDEGDEGDEGNWEGDEWDSQDLFMAERPSSPLPAPPSKLETRLRPFPSISAWSRDNAGRMTRLTLKEAASFRGYTFCAPCRKRRRYTQGWQNGLRDRNHLLHFNEWCLDCNMLELKFFRSLRTDCRSIDLDK